MNENCKVPLPIIFNCWKHHAHYIKENIEQFSSESQIEDLNSAILKIGESQMDLYYGHLSYDKIAGQIISFLSINSLNSESEYLKWLYKDGSDYQSITIADKSVWTMRSGNVEKRFVHIHPGRYSPYTVRVKALTLKTVIYVLAISKIKSKSALDIDLINDVRKKHLTASPLKSVSSERGLGKLLTLFNKLA